jgi:hypothetical protein
MTGARARRAGRTDDLNAIPVDDPLFVERFEAKVDCSGGPDSCHLWTASQTAKGKPASYGLFSAYRYDNRRNQMACAHRVAYRLYCGPITPGLDVLHSCDTPLCCNPRHLRLGSPAENSLDMRNRKRNPKQVLTKTRVLMIRAMRHYLGLKGKEIARIMGLKGSHVSLVTTGRLWDDVETFADDPQPGWR